MNFIGRENEKKKIESILKSDGFQSCILYGRRRLGKTELLKQCLSNKNVPLIFYQCTRDNERNNIDALTALVKDVLNVDNLFFTSFINCIEYIFKISKDKKIYFVIDEIPYIIKLVNGFESQLQKVIDTYHTESQLKFFICGSSISIMKSILMDNNPLYERFNNSILLKEMDYYDSSKFYPNFSNEDKVRLYAAFGGIPFYLKQINQNISVKENIINIISGSFSSIGDDITYSLKEELTKINNAFSVFSVIAKGAFHYSDILNKANLPTSSALYDVLSVLENMDLIEYICPINDKNNKKKSGYKIKDNILYFYYRYIYSNLSSKTILSDETFYDLLINDDFEKVFVPKVFEKISKEFLIRKNILGKLPNILLDIGTYWYDCPNKNENGQFDVVGKCKDGYIFYEAKYTNKKINDLIIKEEIEQVNKTSLQAIGYGFISKSGFDIKDKVSNIELYTLEDIYNYELR